MSFDLDSIVVNHATTPPRIVIYGDHGIGKTTFGTSAPSPIVLPTEKGLAAIRVPAFPLAKSYGDVLEALNTLYSDPRATHFQTLVVDSLDWLEPLVWTHTASLEGKNSIEDIGYGKGYTYADEHWRTILDGFDALNAKGMTIICLAHAKIERFNAPDTEPYDRYQIKLHKRASGIIQEWADVIGFAHHDVVTVSQDAAAGKKVNRGVSVGTRTLSVEERPAYYAKNRYSLPAEIPFPKVGAWDAFATSCAPAFSGDAPEPLVFAPLEFPAPSLADQQGADQVEALFGGELAEMRAIAAADERLKATAPTSDELAADIDAAPLVVAGVQ